MASTGNQLQPGGFKACQARLPQRQSLPDAKALLLKMLILFGPWLPTLPHRAVCRGCPPSCSGPASDSLLRAAGSSMCCCLCRHAVSLATAREACSNGLRARCPHHLPASQNTANCHGSRIPPGEERAIIISKLEGTVHKTCSAAMEGTPAAQSGLKRATATVDCPKSMVGRVIGKSGETIKALQTYTGALIQASEASGEWMCVQRA